MNISISENPEGSYGLPFPTVEVTVRTEDPATDWPTVRKQLAGEVAFHVPALPTRYFPAPPVSDESGIRTYEDVWLFRKETY